MWIYVIFVVCQLTLLIMCEGKTIKATPGDDTTLQWTLDPVPPSSVQVTVLHPTRTMVFGGKEDFVTLFSVLGTTVLPGNTDIGRRVTNTVNTNTVTGHIEFTLNDITANDAGDYRARYRPVSGANPTDYVGIRLVVYVKPFKPIITTEAGPVVGRTMILNCSTLSNTKPDGHGLQMNYKWYMNGADLPSYDRYVTSGSHLEVANIQKSDEDTQFICKAYENITIPSNSSLYIVHVRYGPDTVSPNTAQQHTLIEKNGTLGPIKCSADCVPTCKYQWKFNGINHSDQGDTLTIKNIPRTLAGSYWCIAFNDYGNKASKNVTVNVQYKPKTPYLTKSKDGDNMENERISITCSTDSVPLPDITITSSTLNKRHYVSHGKLNSTLTIEKADCLDTGKYVCNANNTIGAASSNPLMVNVTCQPRLDQRNNLQTNIYIGDNDILNITATIIANPPPVLSWILINDTGIALKNNTDGFVYYEYHEDTYRVTYTSRAIKSQMKSGDYGQYVLKASNILGDTNVTFDVFAKRSPDPPSEASVDCFGQTAATVKWRSNFNGGEKQRFQLKSVADSAVHQNIDDKGINLIHEATIDHLKPDTLYSFVVEAHNNNGRSTYERLLNCTTKPLENQAGTSSAVIGGAAGGSAAFIVIIIVLGVILFIKRRKQGKADDKQHVNMGYLQDDPDDGKRQNIHYESAGPNFNKQPSNPNNTGIILEGASSDEPSRSGPTDVYAPVMKNKKQPEDPDVVYSVVQKSNKTIKKDEPKDKQQMKKQKQTKGVKKQPKGAIEGDVYENFEGKSEEEYAKISRDQKQVSSENNKTKTGKISSRRKNKDGLTYVDVDIIDKGNVVKINGIHGADKKVEYVDIDFTKRADPLPSDDDDEEEAEKKSE